MIDMKLRRHWAHGYPGHYHRFLFSCSHIAYRSDMFWHLIVLDISMSRAAFIPRCLLCVRKPARLSLVFDQSKHSTFLGSQAPCVEVRCNVPWATRAHTSHGQDMPDFAVHLTSKRYFLLVPRYETPHLFSHQKPSINSERTQQLQWTSARLLNQRLHVAVAMPQYSQDENQSKSRGFQWRSFNYLNIFEYVHWYVCMHCLQCQNQGVVGSPGLAETREMQNALTGCPKKASQLDSSGCLKRWRKGPNNSLSKAETMEQSKLTFLVGLPKAF